MRKLVKFSWAIMILMMVTQLITCKKDKKEPDVLASFSFAIDENDFKTVIFTNESQNYKDIIL